MNHEQEFIRAFLRKDAAERYIQLIGSPKHRRKFLDVLAHFDKFDSKYVVSLPASVHTPEEIARLLRAKGAPESCWVISEWSELDGQQMQLDEALKQVIGQGMGTIISCVPGRLAYFEGEGPSDRLILERGSK